MTRKHLTFAEKIILQQIAQVNRMIDYFGSQTAVADQLGVTRQAVSLWLSKGKVSKSGAYRAEIYDPKYFKKEEIRPDVKW